MTAVCRQARILSTLAKSPSSRRALTRETVLRCAPHFSLRWQDGGFTAEIEGRKFLLGSDGPALLQAFAHPRSLAGALEPLRTGVEGGRHWMELTNTVVGMLEAGLLVEEDPASPAVRLDSSGFGAASIHIRMLNDKARTAAFLAAVRQVVRPGDVVADLGTGTGVLAIAAAQAGAQRVFAVEASGIGRLAERMFQDNGVADRIELLAGWSTRLQLPKPADVLVSEIIGNDPLAEQALELVLDARKRWLKPGARLIPSRLRILALPVMVSDEQIRGQCFVPEVLTTWSSWYGLSFEPLAQAAPGPASMTRSVLKVSEAKACQPLGDPLVMADIIFPERENFRVDCEAHFQMGVPGALNGVLLYFEAELAPGKWFSVAPAGADPACSWRFPLWVTTRARAVRPGDRVAVRYRYRGGESEVELESEAGPGLLSGDR